MVTNPEQFKPGVLVRCTFEPSYLAIILEKPYKYDFTDNWTNAENINWTFMSVKIFPVGKHISQFERVDLVFLEIVSS